MAGRFLRRACGGAFLSMIYEYALEPELVATWTNRLVCSFVKQNFEFGMGRVVSQFPKWRRWRELVWNAYSDVDDFSKKRLEVLLSHLSEQSIRRRNYRWEPGLGGWIENAEREHQRCPFHAIVAGDNPKNHAHVLTVDDLYDDSKDRWIVSRGLTVPRNAEKIADAVAPLLRCSTEIIFVDPYFGPERRRYRRQFEAFMKRVFRQRLVGMPKRIEVHTATDNTGTREFFQEECDRRLRLCIPKGMSVIVRRLRQKQDGEKLHNRYILTDLGGVVFGTGLDEGEEGETDDITLMDRHQYDLRWSQYGGDPPAGFVQEGDPIEVVGTRRSGTP